MTHDLPSLAQLIKHIQQVPYLASKNLFRVAHHFLEMDQKKLEQFIKSLQEAQQQLVKCSICFVWMERSRACMFCSSAKRDATLICVVETWYDVHAIERSGAFTGVYHVLGGAISPLDGIGPEHLTIPQLIQRVQGQPVKEIILAMNQTTEGEATAAYVARMLEKSQSLVTCLARGVPVGGTLEFIDRVTVHKALTERRPF